MKFVSDNLFTQHRKYVHGIFENKRFPNTFRVGGERGGSKVGQYFTAVSKHQSKTPLY